MGEICIFVGEKLPPKTKSDELFGLLSRFIAAWKGSVKSYKEKSIRKDKSAAKDAEKEAKSAMKTKLKNDNGSSSGSGAMKAKKMSPRGPPSGLKLARGMPPTMPTAAG